ncbi:MAG: hypothetical protein HQ504_00270 [Rhodospirillaceae bacterium]|nr:hypothetical protein [Rhodospirillaceae bacterium]
MDDFYRWFSNFENVMELVGQTSSTLLGASLAFLFGLVLYRLQKKHENLGYLHFSISALSATINNLYLFKQQMVLERHEEALLIEDQMNNPVPNDQGIAYLDIKEMTMLIQVAIYEWSITPERLYFLVNRDPNIILLLGVSAASLGTLNGIILTLNDHIDECRKSVTEPPLPTYLISITKNLMKQVDSTIYLVEKCADLLVQYGQVEFKQALKIETTTFTDDAYKKLRPEPMESWESYTWLPKKKAWYQKLFNS